VICARHAQFRAQEVDRARLHGDGELLVDPQGVVPTKLAERRVLRRHVLVDGLLSLECWTADWRREHDVYVAMNSACSSPTGGSIATNLVRPVGT
jgi:hypothetical protein